MRLRHVIFLCLTVLLNGAASSNDDVPIFTLKESEPRTGTNIPRETVRSGGIPLNKRYDELSVEQQNRLKAQYEPMGPNDEPPFPANGLAPVYRAIAAGQQKLGLEGRLSLLVEINSQGEATSISVLQSGDPRMTDFVAAILMREPYKPARCNGTPCKMQFPFRIQFSRHGFQGAAAQKLGP